MIEQLKQAPVVPGSESPILRYLNIRLGKGQLNHLESIELSRQLLQKGKRDQLKTFLMEGKLTYSEALGDDVRLTDIELALNVYLHMNVTEKVITCFAGMGQPEEISLYAKEVGYAPDYMDLLQRITKTDPEKAAQLATCLIYHESGPLVDIEHVRGLYPCLSLFTKSPVLSDCGHLHAAKYDPTRDILLARRAQGKQARARSSADPAIGDKPSSCSSGRRQNLQQRHV